MRVRSPVSTRKTSAYGLMKFYGRYRANKMEPGPGLVRISDDVYTLSERIYNRETKNILDTFNLLIISCSIKIKQY